MRASELPTLGCRAKARENLAVEKLEREEFFSEQVNTPVAPPGGGASFSDSALTESPLRTYLEL